MTKAEKGMTKAIYEGMIDASKSTASIAATYQNYILKQKEFCSLWTKFIIFQLQYLSI